MSIVLLQDDNIKVKVPVGTSMREVAFKTGASMPFGCRVGDCGECVAHVLKGADLLNERTEKETGLLQALIKTVSDERLMCQCKVIAEEGEIEISYGL